MANGPPTTIVPQITNRTAPLVRAILKLPNTSDFGEQKRPQITGVHSLGPPPKRRKHDQNAFHTAKRSTTPLLPPKRSIIELDSDGEETGLDKVKVSPSLHSK